MQVETAFERWLDKNPEARGQSNLVAVSGGIDSMVLLDLCFRNRLSVEVVHVNYGLRGEDSESGQKLVVEVCARSGVKCHVSRWVDEEASGSLQMRCRDFRYAEFKRLMDGRNLENTVVAHHADDSVETVLLNIFRGTGIRGLTGITENRERILRPLLFCNKEDIEEYAAKFEVEYLEDASNATSHYDRNFLRNELLPLIRSRFEKAGTGILNTAQIAKETAAFVNDQISAIVESALVESDHDVRIDLEILRSNEHFAFILGEYLTRYGFSRPMIDDILSSERTGAQFQSANYQAHIDRNKLIISKLGRHLIDSTVFDLDDPPTGFTATLIDRTEDWRPNECSNIGEFDNSKLAESGLELRSWREGDRLKPLGMSGWKKLSDLFIDLKIPISEKSRVPILTSDDAIIWVVGLRIDDRFKVIDSTTSILRIEYHRSE